MSGQNPLVRRLTDPNWREAASAQARRAETAEADAKTAWGFERKMTERATAAEEKLESAENEIRRLGSVLRKIADQQPKTIRWLRANGIVFDGPLGTDPSNWQNVAFSIYTDLCEVDSLARQALER